MSIYADYAAATPVDDTVLAAMLPYFADNYYNPSALYMAAGEVRNSLERARADVAGVLGTRPTEVTFTAGATEANNLVIRGVMAAYPDAELAVSAVEHDSVLRPAQAYGATIIPVDFTGLVSAAAVQEAVTDETVLVSVMYANNEVGTIQPIRAIAAELKAIRAARWKAGNTLPLYFHTDAAQAANYLDLHVSRLGVDFMTLNGGKIYGPKQSGAVFVSAAARLQPQVTGGGQEHGLRAGTENVAGAVGLATALAMVQHDRQAESRRVAGLRDLFAEQLLRDIPTTVVNGSQRLRLPNNAHLTFPGEDNERLLMQLDEAGILAAAGSACSAGSGEPSHVLGAMGISDEAARSSLRFTFGRQTTEADIQTIAAALLNLIARR